MKNILIVLLCVLSSAVMMAQTESKEDRKAEKAAKKEQRAAQERAAFEEAKRAMAVHDFVLEAERVDFTKGMPEYVNPATNFVSLRGNIATVQLNSKSVRPLANGVGGVTVEGRASDIKMSYDKKGNMIFFMAVFGRGVSANVEITLMKDSNKCQAEVDGNFSGGTITFSGDLYPAEKSGVFKGRSL